MITLCSIDIPVCDAMLAANALILIVNISRRHWRHRQESRGFGTSTCPTATHNPSIYKP